MLPQLKTFADSQIPVFLSQYGCNLGACGARIFQETSAIYSPVMTSVFSGGVAYEFYDSPDIQSAHWGYGLVRVEHDAVVGRGLTKLPDFDGLKARLEACEDEVTCEPQARGENGRQGQTMTTKEMPPLSKHWKAGCALPYSLADWGAVSRGLDEKAWVEVQVEEVERIDLNLQPKIIRA